MKRIFLKTLSLLLALLSWVSVISIPAFAYSYSLEYEIIYKATDGTVLGRNSGYTDAQYKDSVSVRSPSFDGYLLSDPDEAVITGDMISWYFPPSNYIREGSGSYTVYYEQKYTVMASYLYGISNRIASPAKSVSGKYGEKYIIYSPTLEGYTPDKQYISGRFNRIDSTDIIYYYENSYTISFDANKGTGGPDNITKMHFSDTNIPTEQPYRTGYTFLGWSEYPEAPCASYKPGQAFDKNQSLTLYAVWTPKKYMVTYDANKGTGAPKSQSKYYGSDIVLSGTIPQRPGYVFCGWGLSDSASVAAYQPKDIYKANGNRTLYAVWEEVLTEYTVRYYSNGGSGAPSRQKKLEGIDLVLSENTPTRNGYSFLGWATESDSNNVEYKPSDIYSKDESISLYAVWSCDHESISRVWQTGCIWNDVCDSCKTVLDSGLTHGPFIYSDWQYFDELLHKRTKECKFEDSIKFEYESHKQNTKYSMYSDTEHLRYLFCPDCNSTIGSVYFDNHNFVTDYYDGKIIKTCTICGYSDTSLQTFTVSYDANGGTGAPDSQIKVYGTDLVLSDIEPIRTNYSFLGWARSDDCDTYEYLPCDTISINENISLYAVWEYSPGIYTVQFDSNDTKGVIASLSKINDIPLTIPSLSLSRMNYTFLGWSQARDASVAQYRDGDHFLDNCDTTLYAVWEYTPETYDIIFDANCGFLAPEPLTKIFGIPQIIPEQIPQRKSYQFLGWSRDKNSSSPEYMPFDSYTEEEDATLYAIWQYMPETYLLCYEANGGVGAPDSQSKTENTAIEISHISPTREGYIFKGWATEPDSDLVIYMPGDEYTENESKVFYAVWRIQRYSIIYMANGGTDAPLPSEKIHGTDIRLSYDIPKKDGYAFMGWSMESDSDTIIYLPGDIYEVNEDVFLYAVWQGRNCDFSVTDLSLDPAQPVQYGNITVRMRLDSWDKYIPYDNVSVNVYIDDTIIYSEIMDFEAYAAKNIVFSVNVGAIYGTHTIYATINSDNYWEETVRDNNEQSKDIYILKVSQTSAEHIDIQGEYIASTQVISSFFVTNEGAFDITPFDNVSFRICVYISDKDTDKIIYEQTKYNIVVPANGKNLVYFKWTIPDDCAGKTIYCKGQVCHENSSFEQNSFNNTNEYAISVKDPLYSQTPNTAFEKYPPTDYDRYAQAKQPSYVSASWERWEYENGELVLKSYGIKITDSIPKISPDTSCNSAYIIGDSWYMKSGYGISLEWKPSLSKKEGTIFPDIDSYTEIQNAYATFPEFSYSKNESKYRTLVLYDNAFRFISNSYADNSRRVHYIPVYVSDGKYTLQLTATQIWTPAGMISATLNSNTIMIEGSIYDDHYVSSQKS